MSLLLAQGIPIPVQKQLFREEWTQAALSQQSGLRPSSHHCAFSDQEKDICVQGK